MNKIETICIINDDEVYAFIIKKSIVKLSICNHITTFLNGEDAINSFKNISNILPDIILLDIHMPVMDGWSFLKEYELLKLNKNIPIYLISAQVSKNDSLKAADNKFITGVLEDPTDTDTLLKISRYVLAN